MDIIKRREFSPTQRRQIVNRAKNADDQICCEGCGRVLGAKPYEIDHVIAEGLRPDADKKRKLTIAEGQLLGKDCCHRGEDGKTKKDQRKIAKSNRQFDKSHGLKGSKQSIRSAGFPKPEKQPKPLTKQLPPRRSLFQPVPE